MRLGSILAIAISVLTANIASAQIHMSPYVPAGQMSGFDANVSGLLEGKLRNALSQNGMEPGGDNARFILAGAVSLVEKEALGTAPPKVIVHLSLNLAVGDAAEGKCYGSRSVEITGVGANGSQAVTNAVKSLNTKKIAEISELVQIARQRVIDYYNAQAPTIISDAKGKIKARSEDEAIYMLAQIPQECEHYQDAAATMREAYMAKINNETATALQEAKAMWSGDPSCANAPKVAEILATIDTNSNSIDEARELQDRIADQCKLEAHQKHEIEMQRMANEKEIEMRRLSVGSQRNGTQSQAAQSYSDTAITDACLGIAQSYAQSYMEVWDLAAAALWLSVL